jgi:hypothetical protein
VHGAFKYVLWLIYSIANLEVEGYYRLSIDNLNVLYILAIAIEPILVESLSQCINEARVIDVLACVEGGNSGEHGSLTPSYLIVSCNKHSVNKEGSGVTPFRKRGNVTIGGNATSG